MTFDAPMRRGGLRAAARLLSTAFALAWASSAAAQVTATVEVNVRAPVVEAGAEADVAAPADRARGTEPVVAASVTVPESGRTAFTDAGGVARLRSLPPGRTTVLVSALGFEDAVLEVEAVNGRVVRAEVLLSPTPLRLEGLSVDVAAADLPPGGVAVDVAALPPTAVDLPSAVDRVPGATVVRQGGPGAPAVVQLRGSGGDQILVLLDGVPINSPLTGIADLSSVDLSSLERIVVLPGTHSSRYGPRALGGVVLLESRSAVRSSVHGTVGAGAWGSGEVGANGSWASAAAWSFSGGARWERSSGDFLYDVPDFRGGGELERENAAFERIGGDLRIARTGRLDASVQANVADIERGSPGTIAQPSAHGAQRHRRRGVGATLSGGDPNLGGSLRTAVQWQRAEYRDPSPPFGASYDTRNDVRRGEAALEGWWRPPLATARVGVDAARSRIDSNVLATPSVTVEELGLWGRLERPVDLGRLIRLELGAGLRLDRHDLVNETVVSPSLDLTAGRGPLTLELAWGRGFAPPGLGDLFFQEGVLVEPNPGLLPERIRDELSATLALDATVGRTGLSLRTSAYRADVEDMILWFPDFRFIWSPDNFDIERRGLELGAGVDIAAAGGTHSLTADVAWSRVEYTGDVLSGQVVYRPDFSADASLTLDLPLVSVTPTAAWIGERRSVPGSELNTLPAYVLVDLGFAVPFDVGTISGRLDLTLSNLLDERAALLVDYPLPSRGWSTRLRLQPG